MTLTSRPAPANPPSPLQHLFPGAHVARVRSADVVWDHGDLAAEYGAIRGSAAKIDLSGAGLVEGPDAAKALEDGVDPDLGALPLSGIMEIDWNGVALTVSRTGFTGEYGYKIFVAAADAPTVWEGLGELTPAGVGALEVAMFEVRQPLLHRETPTGGSALETGYAWLIDITKESFHGRDAVVGAFESGVRSRVVGYVVPGARAAVPQGAEVRIGDEVVGESLHSVFSPGRGEWIGLARLRPELIAPHLDVTVGSNGSSLPAQTISAPYVIPSSWKAR